MDYSVVIRNGHFSQSATISAQSEHDTEVAAHRACRAAGKAYRVVYSGGNQAGPWLGLDLENKATVEPEADDPAPQRMSADELRRYGLDY